MESQKNLHLVVRAGDLEALLELLARGVNANMKDQVFVFAQFLTSYQDDCPIHACDNSSHRNCDEQGGETALMAAAHNGHHECISILVANGADVNMASKVQWR